MNKAYNDKEQFTEEANKYIKEIERILNSKYEELLNKGYSVIEIHDIINHSNNLQRGKHVWNNIAKEVK